MASLQPVTYDLWIPLLAKLTCCLWAAVRWGLNSCSGAGKQAPEQAVLQGTLCPEFQLLWQPLDPSWLLLKAMIMNIVSTSWFLFFFNTEIFTTHLFHNHMEIIWSTKMSRGSYMIFIFCKILFLCWSNNYFK